jgi:hypothetical protein
MRRISENNQYSKQIKYIIKGRVVKEFKNAGVRFALGISYNQT